MQKTDVNGLAISTLYKQKGCTLFLAFFATNRLVGGAGVYIFYIIIHFDNPVI